MPLERNWDLRFDFTNNIVDMYAGAATPKDGWRWSYPTHSYGRDHSDTLGSNISLTSEEINRKVI